MVIWHILLALWIPPLALFAIKIVFAECTERKL
jgi:hypothetical protein